MLTLHTGCRLVTLFDTHTHSHSYIHTHIYPMRNVPLLTPIYKWVNWSTQSLNLPKPSFQMVATGLEFILLIIMLWRPHFDNNSSWMAIILRYNLILSWSFLLNTFSCSQNLLSIFSCGHSLLSYCSPQSFLFSITYQQASIHTGNIYWVPYSGPGVRNRDTYNTVNTLKSIMLKMVMHLSLML